MASLSPLDPVSDIIGITSRLATLEIIAMGRKLGLPLAALTEAIGYSTVRSHLCEVDLPALQRGTLTDEPGLGDLAQRLDGVVDVGTTAHVPLPLTQLARALLHLSENAFAPNAAPRHLFDWAERTAGTRLCDMAASAAPLLRHADAPMADDAVVGYVGLGAMGAAIVRRLLQTRPVHVFDVNQASVDALLAEGAVAAPDLVSLARTCDIVFICVPTSDVVRKVLFAPGGLADGLSLGKIVVDQTTGDPWATREIAEALAHRGISLIDAPVSGGPAGAAAGTIATLCAGPLQAFETVRPVLALTGPGVVYFGETGNGHIAKLIKNAMGACNRIITYEAATLAMRLNVGFDDLAAAVRAGPGRNHTSERILPVLAGGGQTASLRLELMVKDLGLACKVGRSCGAPMAIAHAVLSMFESAVYVLGGSANIDEIARYVADHAGVHFSANAA